MTLEEDYGIAIANDNDASTNGGGSTTAGDDFDDDHLDLIDQKNRPEGTPIQQQKINAWHPILDPNWVIFAYLALATIMIPFGYHIVGESDKIIELKQLYDVGNITDNGIAACESIGENYNANENCTIVFEVPQDMEPPVLVYYEITSFHQNYRRYTTSRDDHQLTGKIGDQSSIDASNCAPLNILGDTVINPCGLIANTFFNDRFALIDNGSTDVDGNKLVLREDGIAWRSDLKYRYKMPDGYREALCPEDQCDASCCENNGFSCDTPARHPRDGLCYAYDYPEPTTTQYLYQTYPNIVSPLEHVKNEHFVVWMRMAATPDFRKLYGYIDQKVPKGTLLEFEVNMNWVVQSFKGTKALKLTTNSMWGTKGTWLGTTIYIIGYFCLGSGFFFAMKHWLKPRKIADKKYLHFKEE